MRIERGFTPLDEVRALVVVLDARGAIRWWNTACTLLTGCRPEQVQGQFLWHTALVDAPSGTAFSDALDGRSTGVHAFARTYAGERRYISWECTPRLSPGGGEPESVWTGHDITAFKRAQDDLHLSEAALRRSDERFRAIFHHTFQFIGLLSADGTLLEINASALRFAGLEHSQVVGRPFWEARWWTLTPRTQDRLREAIAEASQGRFVRYEAEVLGAGEQVATIDFSLNPVVEHGRVAYIVPEGRDITDRLHMEEALRRSESRFASIFAITADATIVVDAEQHICLFSDGAEEIFGYARAEVVGAPLDMLLPEHSRAAHRQYMLRFGEEGPHVRHMGGRRDVSGRRKSGEEFPAEAAIACLGEGAERLYIVSLQDVTERLRTEREQRFLAAMGALLAESIDYEETLQQVARLMVPELADLCVVTLRTPTGEVRPAALEHVDPAMAEFCRVVLHRYPMRLDAARGAGYVIRTGNSEYVSDMTEQVQQAIARDTQHARMIQRVDVRSYICVPLCARGEVLGAISLFRVGASRRRQGAEDVGLAQELARRAALALDHSRLYREALAANQAKADFLATMSHELRTPLNAVLGYAELLLMGIPVEVAPEAQEHVHRIGRATRHLISIIEEILVFSRMEAGRETLVLAPVELAELVREVAAIAEPLAGNKKIRFRTCDPPEGQVVTDGRKLRQILINLLGNAVKFTDRGEVSFSVERGAGEVRFRVADTGVGIAPEYLEKIWEPFRQVQNPMTRTAGGTGLGLSVSRHLARLLGAELTVRSVPGEGSAFTLRLPVS
jgi:PAS domain S-box-containing protein